jgi:hypothetical protein
MIKKQLPNLQSIILLAIESVEYKKIKSHDKKAAALQIVYNFIDTLPESENKIFLTNCYDNGNIADMIDLVVDASKGKLKINESLIKRGVAVILKCLLGFIKTKPVQQTL